MEGNSFLDNVKAWPTRTRDGLLAELGVGLVDRDRGLEADARIRIVDERDELVVAMRVPE